MSLESDEIFIGQTGHVYVGAIGVTFPASIAAPINTAVWTEIGYVDTDGVDFNFPKNFQWIRSWQHRRPTRGVRGDQDWLVGLLLQQWNRHTVPLAFGGGTIVESPADAYRYSPPGEATNDERALLLEASDGSVTVRWGFARVLNQAPVNFKWARSAESKLALEFMILQPDTGDPFYFDTNSAAFDAATLDS